jgi:hypothetical protein
LHVDVLGFALAGADEPDGGVGVFDCLPRLACPERRQGAVAEEEDG